MEHMKKNSVTTIKDIAELAGVSVATVGRVIGNYGSFSESSKEKVMEAARKLNYIPNAIAQGMRRQSTQTIAVLVGSIKNSFFSEIAYNIEKEAMKRDYNVLIGNTFEDVNQEISQLRNMYSKRIDGIIIAPAYTKDRKIREEYLGLYEGDIPTVFVDRKVKDVRKNLVQSNNIQGAYESTKYLLDLGHRQIAVIATSNYITVNERIQGYKKALSEYGIPFDKKLICYSDWFESTKSMEAARKLLDSRKDITAIEVLNNSLISSVWKALKEKKLSVPEDISLLAWDDDEINEVLEITTVRQNIKQMARLAAQDLFSLIEDKKIKPKDMIKTLETEFIIRKSCTIPKGGKCK